MDLAEEDRIREEIESRKFRRKWKDVLRHKIRRKRAEDTIVDIMAVALLECFDYIDHLEDE